MSSNGSFTAAPPTFSSPFSSKLSDGPPRRMVGAASTASGFFRLTCGERCRSQPPLGGAEEEGGGDEDDWEAEARAAIAAADSKLPPAPSDIVPLGSVAIPMDSAVCDAARRYSGVIQSCIDYGTLQLHIPFARVAHLQVLSYFFVYMEWIDRQRDAVLAADEAAVCAQLRVAHFAGREVSGEQLRSSAARAILAGREAGAARTQTVEAVQCPLEEGSKAEVTDSLGSLYIDYNVWFQAADPAVVLFVDHVLVMSYVHMRVEWANQKEEHGEPVAQQTTSTSSPRPSMTSITEDVLIPPLPWCKERLLAAVRFDVEETMGRHRGQLPLTIHSRDHAIFLLELLDSCAFLNANALRNAVGMYVTCWMLHSREIDITAALAWQYDVLKGSVWWRESAASLESFYAPQDRSDVYCSHRYEASEDDVLHEAATTVELEMPNEEWSMHVRASNGAYHFNSWEEWELEYVRQAGERSLRREAAQRYITSTNVPAAERDGVRPAPREYLFVTENLKELQHVVPTAFSRQMLVTQFYHTAPTSEQQQPR